MRSGEMVYRIKRRWTQREWRARLRRDEGHVQALLARTLTPDSCCVDVGANEGEFLHYFNAHAPGGTHIAVEPLPDLAERLRTAFPGVEVHQVALAAEPGAATFYRPVNDPAWSGLARQDYPDDMPVEELEVRLARLDALVDDPAKVDFVKIDVEGAELGVLAGMDRILAARHATLLFEHAAIHAHHFATTPEHVHQALHAAGYQIHGLDGQGPYDVASFIRECERSTASGYDRTATTNWIATPTPPDA